MFTDALFVTSNYWKQSNVHKLVNVLYKFWYIFTEKYYFIIKKEQIDS